MARTAGSRAEITGPLVRAAAQRLFARHGYAAVSMRRIAAEVGVQAGALYAYTPDKDGNGKWSTLDTKPAADATSGVFTTGKNGQVTFPALDEGKYTIEEIAAPNGYVNVGVFFSFTIAANLSGTGADQTAKPSYTIDADGVRRPHGFPSMRISPASGAWTPDMILMTVLLPQPFSPSR